MVYCLNFCRHTECQYHFFNAEYGARDFTDRLSSCRTYMSDTAKYTTHYAKLLAKRKENTMQFYTSDFALWTIEEYTRPDGTKPEVNESALLNLQAFGSMADLFSQKFGEGKITTDIDPETENLVIEFSSEGLGKGRLELENVFKK